MHRKFVISGDPVSLRELAGKLAAREDVVRVSMTEGTLKPRGATLEVQALNRSADEVLRLAQAAVAGGKLVVEISESTSIIDVKRQRLIDHDDDEMLWEEMEQNLRNQARISVNALVLMALGGAIATVAVVAPPSVQLEAFVAASIIAPGFDGIASVSLGLVLRQWRVLGLALVSTGASYLVALLASALTFVALRALGASGNGLDNQGVAETLFHGTPILIMSAASAIAGALMIVSLRDIYVVGPLIGLMLVPSTAILGCALVCSRWGEAARALQRMGVDAGFVVIMSALVFWWKQRAVHHRRPLE